MKTKSNLSTKDITRIAMFTVLIAIGAFIRIPIPMIPFTLQVMFVIMAGLFLGKKGGYSALIYVILGLIGLPIFVKGGGLGYILQPTFGYLIGFVISAFVVGKIAFASGKLTKKSIVIASIVGLAIIYVIGVVYLYLICNYVINTPMTFWVAFLNGFLVTIVGDIISVSLAAILAFKLVPKLK